MSYILEALKKAQAERQIGALPTIHAPSLQGETGAAAGARLKQPLLLALVSMAALIVVLLALVWRQTRQAAATPAPAVASVPAPVLAPPLAAPTMTASAPAVAGAPATAAAAAAAPASAAPTLAATPPPAAAIAALAATQAVAPAPGPVPASAPASVPAPRAVAAPVSVAVHPADATEPAAASRKAAASPPVAAPAAIATTAAADEPIPSLRELPEPIQRAIPPVTVGGYIYSRNPADRLLVIDKVLRHEGEELAPGFVLEKLQPKAAIFNYKGYRYRVGY